VLVQIATSFVLLIVSGLFVRALHHATSIDPGFNPQKIVSVRLYLAKRDFTDQAGLNLYDRVLESVRTMPGVQSATLSYASPVISSSECVAIPTAGHQPEVLNAGSNTVGTDYFTTLAIPLIAGRDFNRSDLSSFPAVVIVNDMLAQKYFPGQNSVGMRIRVGSDCGQGKGSEAEIIGVVKDARYATLDPLSRPYVFFPVAQRYTGYTGLLVRTQNSPAALGGVIRRKLTALDSKLRIYEVISLNQQMDDSLWQVRWEAGLLTAFGALALLLAAIGLYGVISSVVTQRTAELGIRMALGANRYQVLNVIIKDVLGLTGVGIAIGLGTALVLTRLLRNLLYGLSPTDPVTLVGAVLLWIAIASLASYTPARRAISINPIETLRHP
jgi:predicted permease